MCRSSSTPTTSAPHPELDDFYLTNLQGNPWQTAVCASRLILSGTLDELPVLDLVLVHGGGHLPYQIGRLDHGHRVRPEAQACRDLPPSRTCAGSTTTRSLTSPRRHQLADRACRRGPGGVRHRHAVRHGRAAVRRTVGRLHRFDDELGVRCRSATPTGSSHSTRSHRAMADTAAAAHRRQGRPRRRRSDLPGANPATGELLYDVAHATADDVDRGCAGTARPPSRTGDGSGMRAAGPGPQSSTAPRRCWPTGSTSTPGWRRCRSAGRYARCAPSCADCRSGSSTSVRSPRPPRAPSPTSGRITSTSSAGFRSVWPV